MSELSGYTVAELKMKLKDAGLKCTGNKKDLIERLKEYYDENGEPAPSEEEEEEDEEEEEEETDKKRKRGSSKATQRKKPKVQSSESESEETNNNNKKTIIKEKETLQKETQLKEHSKQIQKEPKEKPIQKEQKEKPKQNEKEEEEESEEQVSPTNIFIPVDELVKLNGAKVYQDWGVTLNQTEVKTNKNKFYKIQVIQAGNSFYCFTRWGRVGEKGRSAFPRCGDLDEAKDMFVSKFSDKTGNDWYKVKNNYSAFKSKSGLYTLLEMKNSSKTTTTEAPRRAPNSKTIEKPCTLDTNTQKLVKLIFDNDMFKEQMKKLNIDLTKLPLGELSKKQLDKGFLILDRLEEAIKSGKRSKLEALSNEFYTEIPHSHGRRVLPIIQDPEVIQNKRDMLNILGDIEMAHGLSKKNDSGVLELDHPLDGFYKLLDCDLEYIDQKKEEFKILHTYFEKTKNRDIKIMDIWKVNRHSEGDRFSVHDKMGNRKLLWHGTNVAVVVAILKTGLRIMPHSGGRVGRGIYFASENGKSANYVGPAGNTAIMFLNEVVLGKEHHIIEDDSSLVQAPDGYHSIIAKGQTEPDPKKDTKLKIDGHEVVVPQGEPIKTEYYETSSFSQTEYLVYKESQCRIRYLLSIRWE